MVNQNNLKQHKNPIRLCLVQPVQSPYWTERLQTLAETNDLEITLILERQLAANRPGWKPEHIEGVRTEVLRSIVINSLRDGRDLGYQTEVARLIPWRLSFTLYRLRPDVVIVCNATQALWALIARVFLRFKLSIIVEDTLHSSRNFSFVTRVIKGWFYRQADQCIPFSDDAERYLSSIRVSKGIVRSSWSLDLNSFDHKDKKNKIEYSNTSQSKKIVFVGQLIPRKGVMQLVSSWAELPASVRMGAILFLYGTGPLTDDVRNYCSLNNVQDIVIVGQVPYKEIKLALASADLFVLPTLEDLFSLTVIEAMASGCPVITTPFNGARELVQEGINGWIVDPTQTGKLTRVIEIALSSKTNLKDMGCAARLRVENMNNKIVMAKFAQSMRNLVADKL